MRKIIRNIFIASLLLSFVACAVKVENSTNESNIRYLEKWIKNNYPNATQSELGTYILDETPSTIVDAAQVEVDGWAILDYTSRNLEGIVQNTTLTEVAEKYLPIKSRKNFYYPQIFIVNTGSITAGLQDVLLGMKVGESKTVLIPSWLMSYKQYKTKEEYQNEKTEYSNTIYELKLIGFYKNIDERDSTLMIDYISKFKSDYVFASEYEMNITDTVETGFFYYPLEKGEQDPEEESPEEGENPEEGEDGEVDEIDTSININYIGTFLTYNSKKELITKTFDTNIETVAKDFGLYNSSTTYKQKKITWGEDFNETKMDDNKVIPGFSKTLWQLKQKGDKRAIGIFWSKLGYGLTGVTDAIPAYAPLIFEIEIAE